MRVSSWVPGVSTIPEDEDVPGTVPVPVPEGVEIASQAQGSTSGSSDDDGRRSWFAKVKSVFKKAFRCHRPR